MQRRCVQCGEVFDRRTTEKLCPSCRVEVRKCPDCGGEKIPRAKRCNPCAALAKWRDPTYRENTVSGLKAADHPTGPQARNWKGGGPRYVEMTEEIEALFAEVRADGCVGCGISNREYQQRSGERLHVHHVDEDPQNNVRPNLEGRCRSCHTIEHNRRRMAKQPRLAILSLIIPDS